MSGIVEGKVALVTGAASGIGKATAQRFAREGAKVVVADKNADGGEETVRLITENGGDATFVRVDVTDEDSVMGMVARAVETYGRLDCAHNNAGIAQHDYAPANVMSKEVWDDNIATNLTSVMLCMKYEIPQMLEQGGGSIVNTASVAGLIALAGLPAYIASKHGVVGLTKCTALDFSKKNIRVNCVCPGYANTPLMADRVAAVGEAKLAAPVPMARMARPEEIAATVVWLASDEASFVTGHSMRIDGGITAGLIPSGTQGK